MLSFWCWQYFGSIFHSAEEVRHVWISELLRKNGCISFRCIQGNTMLIVAQTTLEILSFWYWQYLGPIFHSAEEMRHVWTSVALLKNGCAFHFFAFMGIPCWSWHLLVWKSLVFNFGNILVPYSIQPLDESDELGRWIFYILFWLGYFNHGHSYVNIGFFCPIVNERIHVWFGWLTSWAIIVPILQLDTLACEFVRMPC